MDIPIAGLIRVVNEDGQLLFWTSPILARRHALEGLGKPLGSKRRMHALLWTGPQIEPAPIEIQDFLRAECFEGTMVEYSTISQDALRKVATLLVLLHCGARLLIQPQKVQKTATYAAEPAGGTPLPFPAVPCTS